MGGKEEKTPRVSAKNRRRLFHHRRGERAKTSARSGVSIRKEPSGGSRGVLCRRRDRDGGKTRREETDEGEKATLHNSAKGVSATCVGRGGGDEPTGLRGLKQILRIRKGRGTKAPRKERFLEARWCDFSIFGGCREEKEKAS